MDEHFFALVCVVCWRLWFLRNQRLHGDQQEGGDDVVGWSESYLQAYIEAQLPILLSKRGKSCSKWVPPPMGTIKVNVDVSFLKDVAYRAGIVTRDWRGRSVGWRTLKFAGHASPTAGSCSLGRFKTSERTWLGISSVGRGVSTSQAINVGDENNLLPFSALLLDYVSISKSCEYFACFHIKR